MEEQSQKKVEFDSIKKMIKLYSGKSHYLLFVIHPRSKTDMIPFNDAMSDIIDTAQKAGYDLGGYTMKNYHEQIEYWVTSGPMMEKKMKGDEVLNFINGLAAARLGNYIAMHKKPKNPETPVDKSPE